MTAAGDDRNGGRNGGRTYGERIAAIEANLRDVQRSLDVFAALPRPAGIERVALVEYQVLENVKQISGLSAALDQLGRNVRGRPSWAVAGILAFMGTGWGITAAALVSELAHRH